MRFSDTPGLNGIKQKLLRSIETGKIAHAQLFAGPSGSANLALALSYAALLNCTDRKEDDSCGECPSCQKISKLIHPDLHFVFPVSSAKNKTGKDVVSDTFITDFRSFVEKNPYGGTTEWSMEFGGENKQLNISREESRNIVKKLTLKPYEGEYKIMIIWLAEYLHPSAANALLKLLEEPPEKTVFLLVTNDYEKIIGTILSRVQMLKIRGFKNEEISAFLSEHYDINKDRAAQLAGAASGDMNYAISLLNEVEDDSQQRFQEWMRICFRRQLDHMVNWADEFSKQNKIHQKGLLQYGMSVVRNALMIQNGGEEVVTVSIPEYEFAKNFAGSQSMEKLEHLYSYFNTSLYHLERNANPKILFMDTSLQIFSVFSKK